MYVVTSTTDIRAAETSICEHDGIKSHYMDIYLCPKWFVCTCFTCVLVLCNLKMPDLKKII